MSPTESRSPLDALARSVPTDEESARKAVAGTEALTADERWRLFIDLLRDMDQILGDRAPSRDEADRQFWRHWRDARHGRPR